MIKVCLECGYECENYQFVTCDNCYTDDICRSCCSSDVIHGEEKFLCPECVFNDVDFFMV
jgi:hypothetical protein